ATSDDFGGRKNRADTIRGIKRLRFRCDGLSGHSRTAPDRGYFFLATGFLAATGFFFAGLAAAFAAFGAATFTALGSAALATALPRFALGGTSAAEPVSCNRWARRRSRIKVKMSKASACSPLS